MMPPNYGKSKLPKVQPERGGVTGTVKTPVALPTRPPIGVTGGTVNQPVRTPVAQPTRTPVPVPLPTRAPVRVTAGSTRPQMPAGPMIHPPERFQGLVNQLATRKNLAKPNVLATMAAKRRAGSY